jgi:hypothetical protein
MHLVVGLIQRPDGGNGIDFSLLPVSGMEA